MRHGGDIYTKNIRYDFSVSLNPMGCPDAVKRAVSDSASCIERYPDIAQRRIRKLLSEYTGVGEEMIVCSNGASELIPAMAKMIAPKRALLAGPTFSGYERALRMAGDCKITEYLCRREDNFRIRSDILELLTEDIGAVFLCVPDNPTGQTIDASLTDEIIKKCRDNDIWLIVDECFLELTRGALSLAERITENPRLLVLRAFTKLFSMPGVRFGYSLSEKSAADKLRNNLPEWNVSVTAEACAAEAIRIARETSYISDSLDMIENEKKFLSDALLDMGMWVCESDAPFIMFYNDTDIYEPLLKKDILIRDCRNFSGLSRGYYRIGIRRREDNETLIGELRDIVRMGRWRQSI